MLKLRLITSGISRLTEKCGIISAWVLQELPLLEGGTLSQDQRIPFFPGMGDADDAASTPSYMSAPIAPMCKKRKFILTLLLPFFSFLSFLEISQNFLIPLQTYLRIINTDELLKL